MLIIHTDDDQRTGAGTDESGDRRVTLRTKIVEFGGRPTRDVGDDDRRVWADGSGDQGHGTTVAGRRLYTGPYTRRGRLGHRMVTVAPRRSTRTGADL
ncbi:hypothetical protein GCM10009779_58630 [Polymorphospora rubra]|uniref:Uncharacterized protein n=1 Tax=Polymorphospora rubra TaxID=338584 RepID=A0A810N134_9ACTN|nr:hypothetical protein Prubr_41430 [Polymorphospora rubra]